MSAFIGAIQNISTMTAMLDLYVYDDGIAVCRGATVRALVARTASEYSAARLHGESAFRQAVAEANERDFARAANLAGLTHAQLIAADPKNRFVALSKIASARLSRRWDGSSRLELTLTDQTRQKYTWKRVYNDPEKAAGILRTALGDRLSV